MGAFCTGSTFRGREGKAWGESCRYCGGFDLIVGEKELPLLVGARRALPGTLITEKAVFGG